MSWVKKIIYALITIIVLIMLLISFVMYTQTGFNVAIYFANKYVPHLSIGEAQGSLSHFQINDIHYQTSELTFSADYLAAQLSVSDLWSIRANIQQLQANQLYIKIQIPSAQENDQNKDSSSNGDFHFPIPLHIKKMVVNDFHMITNELQWKVAHLEASLNWEDVNLQLIEPNIDDFSLIQQQTKPSTQPESENTSAESLEQQLHYWTSGAFSLPDIRLPFKIAINDLSVNKIKIMMGQSIDIDSFYYKGAIDFDQVSIDKLTVSQQKNRLMGEGNLTLKGNWPLNIHLQGKYVLSADQQQNFAFHLQGSLLDHLVVDSQLTGKLTASLVGSIALRHPQLPLSFDIQSDKLVWPLEGKPQLNISNAHVSVEGSLENYHIQGMVLASGEKIPQSKISWQGNGDLGQLTFSQLQIDTLNGQANIPFQVRWHDGIDVETTVKLSSLDLSALYPQYPIKINGFLSGLFKYKNNTWKVKTDGIDVSGQINQSPFSIKGAFSGDSSLFNWHFTQLAMQLGQNHARLDGVLSKKDPRFDFSVYAPALGHILPELSGQVLGHIHVQGSWETPNIEANIKAHALHWQDYHLEDLSLSGLVTAHQLISGDILVDFQELVTPQILMDKGHIELKGSEKQHTLSVSLDSSELKTNIHLTGQYVRNSKWWKGAIDKASIQTLVGRWKLHSQAPLDYLFNQKRLQVGAHCWYGMQGELCLDKTAQIGQDGQISVSLKKVELATLEALSYRYKMLLRGVIDGNANVNWTAKSALPTVNVKISSPSIIIQKHGDEEFQLALENVNTSLLIDKNRAYSTINVELNHRGKIHSAVAINDINDSRQLSGQVDLSRINLALFSPLLDKKDELRGEINGQLKLGGALNLPMLNGGIKLQGLFFNGNTLPIKIKDGLIDLTFQGLRSNLTGKIVTTEGELALNGKADWRDINKWMAKLSAKGDRIKLRYAPYGYAVVSPDIQVTATTKKLSIEGKVDIPEAEVEVVQLPASVVKVSADQVLLDNNLQPIQKAEQLIQLQSQVMITIGPKAHFSGFGFASNVEGNMLLRLDEHGLGLHGICSIKEGRFRAYGQDLLVRKGNVVFAGPVNKPQLDIEAIRNPEMIEDNVTAGLKVTGTPDKPKLILFSQPAMEQQQILSYLLRGQALSDDKNNDNQFMAGVLIGLGTSTTGNIVEGLGNVFGIKQLTLDTKGMGDNSQVVVSGYLLPKLRVEYGLGIFDSLGTLTLRYQLLPKLYVEAASGLNQTLDFLYQFSFD